MGYIFKRTKQPTPGTGDLAFIPAFSLPPIGFIGPGIGAVTQLHPLQQAPQVYYNLALVQDGINGIPTGTMSQPGLEDMETMLAEWTSSMGVA